jgi:hypothetical protein
VSLASLASVTSESFVRRVSWPDPALVLSVVLSASPTCSFAGTDRRTACETLACALPVGHPDGHAMLDGQKALAPSGGRQAPRHLIICRLDASPCLACIRLGERVWPSRRARRRAPGTSLRTMAAPCQHTGRSRRERHGIETALAYRRHQSLALLV